MTVYDATSAYDADSEQLISHPPEVLPRVAVEVQPNWNVTDVLVASGHTRYHTFALVTPEMESDFARAGEDHMITAVHNLFGIDDRGAIKFQDQDQVTWAEFLRAAEAGLHRGDPTRIVIYPYAGAGGPSPDGLWEAVEWLFENRDVAVSALEDVAKTGGGIWALEAGRRWITGVRRRQIARQWRAQGFTAQRIRDVLGRCPQWDPSEFAKRYQLTEPEARLALTNAGYQAGQDGLWRLADTVEGRERRKVMEEIEQCAYANIENGWPDDFPLDEDESDDDR